MMSPDTRRNPFKMTAAQPPGNDSPRGEDEVVRRGWLVSGRVQGVGFRWWTARTARALGLRGTVENLPDGRVEVHAEGPAEAVNGLHRRLHDGPTAARVDDVDRIDPARELPTDFRIVG